MTTLYYSPGACSLAAHIILEEIGKPFEARAVPIREGAHLSPEYLAINPRGRVPTLVEDGMTLTESPAILHYLAHREPAAGLIDLADVRNLGRVAALLNHFSATVHGAFAQVWRAARFAGSDSAQAEVVQYGRASIHDHFDEIEELASAGEWLVGDRFSIADPYLLVFYRWGTLIGLDMTQYGGWTEHKNRMIAREAVQRALAREGIMPF